MPPTSRRRSPGNRNLTPEDPAPKIIQANLSDLKPDPQNANAGTPRGMTLLSSSLQDLGAGRSILIDKNGYIIAGNKTAAQAKASGLTDVLIVQTAGNQVVAVQRTDLDLSKHPKARRLAFADNRIGELNLSWNGEEILALALEYGEELTKGLWTEDEYAALTNTTPDFEMLPEETAPRLDQLSQVTCPACQCEFIPGESDTNPEDLSDIPLEDQS